MFRRVIAGLILGPALLIGSFAWAGYLALGTIFDEQDDCDRAERFYRKANLVPDAHYNLARIHELAGDEINARRHLRLYHRLIDEDGT